MPEWLEKQARAICGKTYKPGTKAFNTCKYKYMKSRGWKNKKVTLKKKVKK